MNTRKLVVMAFFIVLEVVFTRFISISLPIMRIGFTFVPMAIAGYLLGPMSGGFIAVVADLIGSTLWPSGPYFIGFTISAFLTGASYGFLKGKKDIWKWVVMVGLFNTLIVNSILNTAWLNILYGKTWMALLPPRIGKELIILPLRIFINGKILTSLKKNNTLSYQF